MLMKLFLVEDATIYMILLQKLLENDFQITLSKNIADAKKIIEDEDYQFDVMLIDLITMRIQQTTIKIRSFLRMPGTMDLIRQIKKNKRLSQVPIVALTASDNPKDLIQAFDYGIYDCIQKPIYEEVVLQRVKNAASNYLRLKELKKLRESLMNNQQIDDLTKIYKFDTAKWLIDEKLDENKTGQKILFVFKLKGLEEVYKQEGSHRGDELVKEMSDFISMNFKNIDILGRVDQDEFVCFVSHMMSKELAYVRKEELLRMFSQKKLSDISENMDLQIGYCRTCETVNYEKMYQAAKKMLTK